MNKKKYLEMRAKLITETEGLIAANKIEDSANKRKEIEKLDNDFNAAAKEQANLNALVNEIPSVNLESNSVQTKGATHLETTNLLVNEINYEDVFVKVALDRELNADEITVFNQMNPTNVYTHKTTNTEIVIPETVIGGIESTMKELHPILADVRATRIKGTVKYVKHTKVVDGDADYYDEDTPTEDEENEFGELVLGGKELSKAVTVSWKLQAMAMSDFVPFLQRELGERMSYAKANAFVCGAGDAKYPQGVITALDAQADKPQIVEYEAGALTYKNITAARGKVKSVYASGSKIYANGATIWNELANLKDENGRPLLIPDVTAAGVGRIFGIPVTEEDAMGNGEVLIGNMANGYEENIQEGMTLTTQQNAKGRKTDFVGYEVHDAGVRDESAFALLRLATGI